jgi:hypothetical protein
MKKIIAILAFMITGVTVSFAQTTTQAYTPVTPTVNAVQMSQPDPKSTTKSCCSSTSKVAAITNAECTSTEAAKAEEAKSDKKCQSVSFGMSAVKPAGNLTKEEKIIED